MILIIAVIFLFFLVLWACNFRLEVLIYYLLRGSMRGGRSKNSRRNYGKVQRRK